MSLKGKRVIGLIPARGGSKGIENKNIYPVGEMLLIDFTINSAKDSKFIDQVFVSSDSNKIIKHAIAKGVGVIKRPDSIAGDESTASDVVYHFHNFITQSKLVEEDEDYFLCYLQPTSPLRNSKLLDDSFSLLESKESSSLISLVKNKYTPFKSFLVDEKGLVNSLFDETLTNQNRQNLAETYRANGAIYTFLISLFISNDGFPSNQSIPYIMNKRESIDIDSYEDIDTLELLLSQEKLKK